MLRINELKVYEDLSEEKVIEKSLKKYKIDDALSVKITKKSSDTVIFLTKDDDGLNSLMGC